MKLFVRIAAMVLTFSMILACFASCGTIKGEKALKKLEELLEASENFYKNEMLIESEQTLNLSGEISGSSISSKQEIEGTLVHIDSDDGNFTHLKNYDVKITTTESDEKENIEKYSTMEGFVNGNIIYHHKPINSSRSAISLKTSCAVEDYKKIIENEEALSPNLDCEHFDETEIKKNRSDGVWEISVLDLKEEGTNEIQKWIDLSFARTGLCLKVSSVELKYEIDTETGAMVSSYLYVKAKSTVYDGVTFSLTTKEKYSLPTDFDPSSVNIDDYDKDTDLKSLMNARNSLMNFLSLNNDSSFKFTSSTSVIQGNYTILSGTKEIDTVQMGTVDEKFVYYIESIVKTSSNLANFTISYDGENQTIQSDSIEPQVEEKSQLEAKAYIASSMMNPFFFSLDSIKKARTNVIQNSLTVTLQLSDTGLLDQIFAQTGMSTDSVYSPNVNLEICINTETHQLISVTYSGIATYSVDTGSYTININAQISDFAQPDLSVFEDQ